MSEPTRGRFRKAYRELSDKEREAVEAIKNTADIMEAIYDNLPNGPSREASLAMTKLEESVMWAVKAVT